MDTARSDATPIAPFPLDFNLLLGTLFWERKDHSSILKAMNRHLHEQLWLYIWVKCSATHDTSGTSLSNQGGVPFSQSIKSFSGSSEDQNQWQNCMIHTQQWCCGTFSGTFVFGLVCVLFGNFTKGLLWQQKVDLIWTKSSSHKLLHLQLTISEWKGRDQPENSLKGKLYRFVGTAGVERYKLGGGVKSFFFFFHGGYVLQHK